MKDKIIQALANKIENGVVVLVWVYFQQNFTVLL